MCTDGSTWARLILVMVIAFALLCSCSEKNNQDGEDQGPEDDDDQADDEDQDDDDDAGPPDLALDEVAPSSAGATVATQVTLRGDGFADGMQVFLDAVWIEDVQVLSEIEALAVFPQVDIQDVGPRDVTVSANDQTVTLADGFSYFFDEDPIVFVHGFSGNASDFDQMIAWFVDLGYPEDHLYAIDYDDNTGSVIPQASEELPSFVDAVLELTGAEKVDIIAHSMGAVSSRLWVKEYGGEDKVRDYVSVSGVNHGNELSCLTLWLGEGAEELCPVYADEEHSVNGVQWTLNGDPDTDDVDETPFGVEDGGEIHWMGALRTDADIIVAPVDSCCLNQLSRGDCSDAINLKVHGVGHINMIKDSGVFETIQGMVREHNQSKP